MYGFSSKDFVPFRYASGGGKSVYFQEDKELNLTEFIASRPAPMTPLDAHIRGKP